MSNMFSNIIKQYRKPQSISPRFLVFLAGLVLIYIANHNKVESLMRSEATLKKEISDLTYERIRSSARLMEMSKQSEVLKKAHQEGLGLEELTEPPRILE